MSNLFSRSAQRSFQALMAKMALESMAKEARPAKQAEPMVNKQHESMLRSFRPSYDTAVGARTAILDTVKVFKGHTTAYYSINYYNQNVKAWQRQAFGWAVVGGTIRPVWTGPVTYK